MTQPNEPAYPECQWSSDPCVHPVTIPGMTLRQRFVLAVMEGIAAGLGGEALNNKMAGMLAREAICLADATLEYERKTQ